MGTLVRFSGIIYFKGSNIVASCFLSRTLRRDLYLKGKGFFSQEQIASFKSRIYSQRKHRHFERVVSFASITIPSSQVIPILECSSLTHTGTKIWRSPENFEKETCAIPRLSFSSVTQSLGLSLFLTPTRTATAMPAVTTGAKGDIGGNSQHNLKHNENM